MPGITFAIDSAPDAGPARGALRQLTGVVTFPGGRGRLDLAEPASGPALAVGGVVLAAPLGGRGDYYLFDSTGVALVRPAARTFSSVSLTRASWRHGDVRAGDEGYMTFGRLRTDTVAATDSTRLREHGPVTVRWHLDRRRGAGPVEILARGWLDAADAPAGETSVLRWIGAARALATVPGGVGTLPPDSLQVTAAVVVAPRGDGAPINLIALHGLSGAAVAQVDPRRLVVPADFTETRWPGFEREPTAPAPSRDAVARWRVLPGGAPRSTP